MNFESERSLSTRVDSQKPQHLWTRTVVDRDRRYASLRLADVQRRMLGLPGGVILSIDRPEDFVSYNEIIVGMGKLKLTTGCIEARGGYDLSFKTGDEYVVTIPFRGHGWASTGATFVEYGHEDTLIVSPLCRVHKHWNGPGEVLSIHIPVDLFDRAFAAGGVSGLSLAPILRIGRRRLRSFMRMVDTIWADLRDSDGPSPFLSAPLGDRTQELLLSLLLDELRSDADGGRGTGSILPDAPYYVRRAKSFVDSNAHLSINVEQVAAAAAVSVRAVQYGFREFLDTTPMQYIRRARYHRAREILLMDRSNRKISDIAIEVGCPNVSQFSREYRSLFGETPSDTMSARKGLVA